MRRIGGITFESGRSNRRRPSSCRRSRDQPPAGGRLLLSRYAEHLQSREVGGPSQPDHRRCRRGLGHRLQPVDCPHPWVLVRPTRDAGNQRAIGARARGRARTRTWPGAFTRCSSHKGAHCQGVAVWIRGTSQGGNALSPWSKRADRRRVGNVECVHDAGFGGTDPRDCVDGTHPGGE